MDPFVHRLLRPRRLHQATLSALDFHSYLFVWHYCHFLVVFVSHRPSKVLTSDSSRQIEATLTFSARVVSYGVLAQGQGQASCSSTCRNATHPSSKDPRERVPVYDARSSWFDPRRRRDECLRKRALHKMVKGAGCRRANCLLPRRLPNTGLGSCR